MRRLGAPACRRRCVRGSSGRRGCRLPASRGHGDRQGVRHGDGDLGRVLTAGAVAHPVAEGVGPEEGFRIEDASKTWSEFLYDDPRLEFAKTFIYLKVRLAFDPPLSSAVMEAINRQISELEWRINVTVDPD